MHMAEKALPDRESAVPGSTGAAPGEAAPVKAAPVEAASADEPYLRDLGARVRAARAAAGLTRRTLSDASGVSERYLAQLEAGTGNASLLLMRRIARSLGVPLPELVDDAAPSDEMLDAIRVLRQLDREQLRRAQRALHEVAASPLTGRASRIALVGLRGAGKSTLGARLAESLAVPFIEVDREIERDLGVTLDSVFALYGQDAYREAERRALERIVAQAPACVIATGGSVVVEPRTYELLRTHCYTVWLRATPEEHMHRVIEQGDLRPVRGREHAMAELRTILAQRERLYRLADATVDTAGRSVDAGLAALRAAVPAGVGAGASSA